MDAEKRRNKILEILDEVSGPISATALSSQLGVSRQVIVGDIALLRASGFSITATPRGYISGSGKVGLQKTVACIHAPEDMEEELNIIVDNGCTVLDVIIEHPVYGQLTGELRISSRFDVSQFVGRVNENSASPLSVLTGGVHLHTLLCPDIAVFERTLAALRDRGFIYSDLPSA